MEGLEIEGKTIDEAIDKACSTFQLSRDKLNIEILAAGNAGFLGLGAKPARIRASRLSLDIALDDLFCDQTKPVAARAETALPAEKPAEPKPADRHPANRPAAPREKGGPSIPKRDAAAPPTALQPAKIVSRPPSVPPPPPPTPDPLPATGNGSESSAAKARRILEGILCRMQIASPVEVEETDEAIVLNIRGDGSGLLIGKRGQNLDAIQYIVNKAVHHSANGQKMIIIDTEEYRKRREESLIALALRLGEKAKKTKKPVTVGHMNAHDRRVIHMAMRDDETLTTKSRGEGEYRKIVILPAHRGTDSSVA